MTVPCRRRTAPLASSPLGGSVAAQEGQDLLAELLLVGLAWHVRHAGHVTAAGRGTPTDSRPPKTMSFITRASCSWSERSGR